MFQEGIHQCSKKEFLSVPRRNLLQSYRGQMRQNVADFLEVIHQQIAELNIGKVTHVRTQ